jgi:hypothetical protein
MERERKVFLWKGEHFLRHIIFCFIYKSVQIQLNTSFNSRKLHISPASLDAFNQDVTNGY